MQEMSEYLREPATIWFLLGLVFLLSEFVLPGLIILFFGIGCWVTSATLLVVPDLSFNFQLIIFLISSLLSLALLRSTLKKWLGNKEKNMEGELEEYVNKNCIAESDIIPEIGGKVSFKGTAWTAHSNTKIKKGDTVVIKEVEGISFIVEPLKN